MPILDQFCLWESPMKCVFQWSKISMSPLTVLINGYIERLKYVDRYQKYSNPLQSWHYMSQLYSRHLSISVYIVFIWVKNTEAVKVMFRYDLEIHITSTEYYQNIPRDKKCTDNRVRCLCSLKWLHQYTTAIWLCNNQHMSLIPA